jgi:ABC-type nitrate/sulfonate/bicarbonate transport system substrate-binding protein
MCQKIGRIILVVLAVVLMAYSLSHAQIRVGYGKTWTTPAIYIGIHNKIFEKEGVDVRWIHFVVVGRAVQALIANDLDMATILTPQIMAGWQKGVKFKAITSMGGISHPASAFVVRRGEGINKISDLKGKTIGINEYGGYFDLYFRHELERNGLNPAKDLKTIEVPIPAVLKSILAKKIDGGALPTGFRILAETKFRDKIRVLFQFSDIDFIKENNARNTFLLVAKESYLKENRGKAKAFLRAYLKAVAYVHNNPKQAIRDWAAFTKFKWVNALPAPTDLPADGKVNIKLLKIDMELLNRYGFLKRVPSPEEVVDHSLLNEVLAGR